MEVYTKYDFSLIEEFISEDITYDSIWVIPQIFGKSEYSEYMEAKLQALKNSQSKLVLKIVYDPKGRPHLVIVYSKDRNGGLCCFTIETVDGKISEVHLTPAAFYGLTL